MAEPPAAGGGAEALRELPVAAGAQPRLSTPRLTLRRWRAADLEPLAAINADAAVMEHFPAPLSRMQSAALIARIERGFAAHGYGLFAVETRAPAELIGFVGLEQVAAAMPFAPAVEIGWRLAHRYWGRGLGVEAAREVIRFAFAQAGLPALVSFTATGNLRSRRLMERLGMTRDAGEDFLHPDLPAAHRLAPHVLYRLAAPRAGAGG